MINRLALRNAISFVLLVIALIGVGSEIRLIRMGVVQSNTRLTLAAYILIAIYAAASIAVRFRANTQKKP